MHVAKYWRNNKLRYRLARDKRAALTESAHSASLAKAGAAGTVRIKRDEVAELVR